jgi:hypothetical protein
VTDVNVPVAIDLQTVMDCWCRGVMITIKVVQVVHLVLRGPNLVCRVCGDSCLWIVSLDEDYRINSC